MKSEISPIALTILFLLLFVSALLFIAYSYLQFKLLEGLRKKLGDRVFEWLTKEVEDEKM